MVPCPVASLGSSPKLIVRDRILEVVTYTSLQAGSGPNRIVSHGPGSNHSASSIQGQDDLTGLPRELVSHLGR